MYSFNGVFACASVCICTLPAGAHQSQKRASEPLELEVTGPYEPSEVGVEKGLRRPARALQALKR